MNLIDTTDPRPREKRLAYQPFETDAISVQYLEIPCQADRPIFWDVVEARRSRRAFGDVDGTRLGGLLWHTAKTMSKSRSSDEPSCEHRFVPSAGGLHPIHVFVQTVEGQAYPLHHYDPIGHALRRLDSESNACVELRQKANSVFDTQSGVVLWLVADFNKVDAVYANAESLVWRDTGVLIGMLCLVAEALELNACGLGICGDTWLKAVVALPSGVHGVGAVVVGGRN